MLLSHRNKANTTVREEVFVDGSLHVIIHQNGDPQKSLIALEAFKKSVAGIKPRPNDGGTAAIRALRDGH